MSATTFVYTFPSVRGVQAGRAYFISQCPIRLLPKLFSFTDAELPPEMRSQRSLNLKRVPEISSYVVENRDSYVFSAITASIDAEVQFEPNPAGQDRLGDLHVPLDARFIINDGQHRHAALSHALEADPSLGDESIAVVFFIDLGLARSQQMFADLNRHSVKPSPSIGVLYDHRDPLADMTRKVLEYLAPLAALVEREKTTLAPKSRKLFTLSAVHQAHKALTAGIPDEARLDCAVAFWTASFAGLSDWQSVAQGNQSAGEIRQEMIHSHGTLLHALGRAANTIARQGSNANWGHYTETLQRIDWSRRPTSPWNGRVVIAGHVSKSNQSVALASSYLKQQLGLEISPDEARAEEALAAERTP